MALTPTPLPPQWERGFFCRPESYLAIASRWLIADGRSSTKGSVAAAPLFRSRQLLYDGSVKSDERGEGALDTSRLGRIARVAASRRRAVASALGGVALMGFAEAASGGKKNKKKRCKKPDTCPRRLCCDCFDGTRDLGCTYAPANAADPRAACRQACAATHPAASPGYAERMPESGKANFCADQFVGGRVSLCVRVDCPV